MKKFKGWFEINNFFKNKSILQCGTSWGCIEIKVRGLIDHVQNLRVIVHIKENVKVVCTALVLSTYPVNFDYVLD